MGGRIDGLTDRQTMVIHNISLLSSRGHKNTQSTHGVELALTRCHGFELPLIKR